MTGGCQNCKQPLKGQPRVFQGVVICDDCFRIVSHCVQRTKNELSMLFAVYMDMLRVALVKGELRLPPAPPKGKEMPSLALSKAFEKMAKNFGGLNANSSSGADGQSEVPVVRLDDADEDGEVSDRGDHQAVPGR